MNKIELCKNIKDNISNLSTNEIDELFKILHKNNSNYTKNNNGIFVNLNWLDEDILIQLDNYISFCLKSQKEINKYETMRNILNDSINIKDKCNNNIDNNTDQIKQNNSNISNTINKQKVSSSMKFYLLKKRFLKQNILANTGNSNDNKLTHEEYIVY